MTAGEEGEGRTWQIAAVRFNGYRYERPRRPQVRVVELRVSRFTTYVTRDRCLVSRDIGDSRACPKLGSWCRRSLASRCLSAKRPPPTGVSRQPSIYGSPVTATMVLTVWSRSHGGRIPIRGALPRGWRSGSSRYAASAPVKASITGRRQSAGTSHNSISRCRRPRRSVGSWWQLGWSLPNRGSGLKAPTGGSKPISPANHALARQVQHRLGPARVEELIAAYRRGATAAALAVQFQIHRTAVVALLQRQ